MTKNARKKKRPAPVSPAAKVDRSATAGSPRTDRKPAPASTRPVHRRLVPVAALAAAVLIAVVALVLSPVIDVAGLFSDGDSGRRAVIVDQLSANSPNPAFAETVTPLLEADGYEVDYFGGDQVTVELYRNLPRGHYDLVILRTHSTAVVTRGEEDVQAVSLFTNEPYTKDRYYDEQVDAKIGFASYTDGSDQWFGITTKFIKESMKGDFDNALVIGMGCQGLVNDLAAEAFAAKGASAFIGWDRNVSAAHTDKATERLLQLIIGEGLSPEDATAKTMRELGPDPIYGGSLVSRS